MRRLFIFILILLSCYVSSKTQVDTVTVCSAKMKMAIKSVVIKPENYSKNKQYPVVYLLNGYGDNYAQWINTVPSIKNIATNNQIIIVCPDGGYSSWYFDSPVDSTSQYESYITEDLRKYVEDHYSVIKDRKGRAITGISMGGHGALYLAIRHRDLFAQAGSMSGGIDLLYSTKKWEISKRLGTYEENPQEWISRSVTNMVDSLKNGELHLMIDCGVSDFFYEINANLHKKLLTLQIDHDYIERPGKHDWDYWANAIEYQLLFFDKYFDKQ
jgi:S-formylglutathione hydrolase FrmB